MVDEKEKTIYDLELHETMTITKEVEPAFTGASNTKRFEITRVPGGWVYSFEFPQFRESPVVFVPFAQ